VEYEGWGAELGDEEGTDDERIERIARETLGSPARSLHARYSRFPASERRWDNLTGSNDFYLKATARI